MDAGPDPTIDPDLRAIASALASTVVAIGTPGWGDRGATYRLDLADGRQVAARRGSGAAGRDDARRTATVMRRLAAAGLPVPSPMVVETASTGWLVTRWIHGPTGAAWLDGAARARQLGERMGRLVAGLRMVDPTGLGLPDHAPDGPDRITRTGVENARRLLDGKTRSALDDAFDRLAYSPDRPVVFAHGDFAPINTIVDADGAIAALLDLEHARLGPPLLDVAWWGWVVRHHHPDAWSASWPTFLSAAGVETEADVEREIHALQLTRLFEAASTVEDDAIRDRWVDRLVEAARW